MSQPEVIIGRTIRCANCGATLEITPDSLAYSCKYCGWIGSTEDVESKGYFMAEPPDIHSIRSRVQNILRKTVGTAFKDLRFTEERATAIPIWIVKVHAYTRYNGFRMEVRSESYPVIISDGRGGTKSVTRVKTYPVYIPVRGVFDEDLALPVSGRKHLAFFGIEEVNRHALNYVGKPLNVKELVQKKFECLEVELSVEEAESFAETYAQDEHRRRAEAMATKLFDCYTDTNIVERRLLFYPIYSFTYEYDGKSFRGTADGVNGEVAKIELPMTRGVRALYLSLGYLGIAAALALGLILQRLDVDDAFRLIAPAVGLLSSLAFYRGTSTQRVKRSLR